MSAKVTRGSLHLECRLTEVKLKQASKTLADSIQRRSAVENRVESYKAQAKAEVAGLDASIALNAALLNNEKEFRMVPCETTYDFKAGKKTTVRLDTAEIVKVDDITDEERQREFPAPHSPAGGSK